eukprot:Skav208531  [mRNA]  locus=scaffold3037:66464:70014:+ [translate_table: standard]
MGGGQVIPLWSVLIVGNLCSLAGLGVTWYQQQLDRAALRELQLRAELSGFRRDTWTPASGQEQRSGAGPGEPSPGRGDLGVGSGKTDQSEVVGKDRLEKESLGDHRYVLLEYDVGGPRLWHERWVLEHVANEEYVVATPDSDVYEDLSLLNDDLRGIRVRAGPGVVPPGVTANQIYPLPAFSVAEEAALRAEATRVAQQERLARRGGAPAPAVGGAPAVAGVGALAGGGWAFPAGTLRWLAAEKLGDREYGVEVAEVLLPKVKGAKHVQDLGGGVMLFVECVDGADYQMFMGRAGRGDIRVLELLMNGMMVPERSLQDVAKESKEKPVSWTLPGPRTSTWCINYLAVEGLGFEGHHERVRQICKVDSTAWGISEHFQVSMALRQALLVDQMNGCNLLSVEIQFRRLQTIEFSYAEKARENENRSMPGKLSLEEQSSFGGVTRQFSTLMICLSLLEHVKQETEKEAVLQKSTMPEGTMPQLVGQTAGAYESGPHARTVARDLLPLPYPEVEAPANAWLSRGCKQRIGKRRSFAKEVRHTVRSLNFLHGGSGWESNGSAVGSSGVSAAQEQTLEFIAACVADLGGPGELDGSEALRALRISEDYGGMPTPSVLGSFDPELVSLPAEQLKPNDLAMLWGEDGQCAVENFIREQVLTSEAAAIQLKAAGVERCYSDPLLRHQPTFSSFVKKLWKLGLVDLSLEEGTEQVEMFCVKKKQNKLRLIIDCRRSNAWFKTPENVKLTSGDSLSKIELEDTEELFVCSADLQNAFYTMKMPEELRRFFCLRSVTAKDMGIVELGGTKLKASDRLIPRVAVLPMGWAWALWWCQRLHERIAERSGLLPEERLQDFSAPPLGKFWHVQYVDNLHVMGSDRDEVLSRFRKAVAALREAGLTVHEEEEFEEQTKILGWQYDKVGKFRPSAQRVWKVRLALRHLLRRGRASGQEIERLLGHITFIALGRRESLSIFGECYTFMQRRYRAVVPLWKSVRKELEIWDGISPLIVQDLRSAWVPQVCAVDASEWGLGVCVGDVGREACKKMGRYNERWRFRLKAASKARAFIHTDDHDRVGDLIAVDPDFQMNDPVERFETVPFSVVDRP